jgi:putative colanic acid biosynthesis acetyltransferase WcaF
MMRLLWVVVQRTLYRWSPTPLYAWRRFLLKSFGAKIGADAHPYPSAEIWAPWNLDMAPRSCLGPNVICYSVAPIRVGQGAVVSQNVHLCTATHDHRDPAFPLMGGEISIGEDAWIAADAFIGPGVSVAKGAVVGARAVVARDVLAYTVVIGNPARPVSKR